MLGNLREQVGVPATLEGVEIAHRVPVRKSLTNRHIIVQFVLRTKRDVVLNNWRKERIMSKDLNFLGTSPFYVDEHLCPELKTILGQPVLKKKEANWKIVWVRNGQVLPRKTENSSLLKISTVADMVKMPVN